jgi:hypothetical protein
VRISDASVLVVDSREDGPDILPGDGLSRDALGRSTLRAAIQEANAAGGLRTIFLEPGRYSLTQRGLDEDQAATGDLDITGEVTIVGAGPGKTIIDAGSIDRVFDVLAGGVLTLAHLTVMGGHLTGPAGDCGGGIRNRGTLTADNIVVANNLAGTGGGLCNLGSGVATIHRSTIAENTAYDNGGGEPRYGAGIYNRDNAQLTIRDSSIHQNRLETLFSRGGGGGIANASGGSVSVTGSVVWGNSSSPGTTGGGIFNDGTFQMTNSTISGNTVVNQSWAASASSAGVYNRGAFTAVGITVSNNVSRSEGGITNAGGVVSIANSLIAGNVAGGHPDVAGVFLSLGHNLVGDASGASGFLAFGDLVDPNAVQFLGPLQDNGGPTLTHALLPGSPAIDAGSNDIGLATDQRGVARPWDGNLKDGAIVDIGAFEAYQGEIRGTLFEDYDGDRFRDPNEAGLVGLTVYLDSNGNGRLDPGEPWTLTRADAPTTHGVSEAGTYVFTGLEPGFYRVAQVREPKWNQTVAGWGGIRRISSAPDGMQGNGQSFPGAVSADGRYVVFTSDATNLVPGVESGFHLYLYHQQTGTIEHLAKVHHQLPREPWMTYVDISADGRYVAFYSSLGLVPDDTNDRGDVFVYDRLADSPTAAIERVSIGADGSQGKRWKATRPPSVRTAVSSLSCQPPRTWCPVIPTTPKMCFCMIFGSGRSSGSA